MNSTHKRQTREDELEAKGCVACGETELSLDLCEDNQFRCMTHALSYMDMVDGMEDAPELVNPELTADSYFENYNV